MNFETEKLVVDWIGLNLQDCKNWLVIGGYLFNWFNFNVLRKTTESSSLERIFWNEKNSYQCIFVENRNGFWRGVRINFSGKNGTYFYNLVKKKAFDWDYLDLKSTSLGRLDIYYQRSSSEMDRFPEKFLEGTIQKLEGQNRHFSHRRGRSSESQILRIGKRTSQRFYRIYATKEGLRFEFEIKGTIAKSFQEDLFLNRLEDFEERVSEHFYKHSKRLLPINQSFTDWLVIHGRKSRILKNSNTCLVTTYLESTLSKNPSHRDWLWKFFQLLSFIHNLKNVQRVKKVLSDQVYYEINFPLQEFVESTGVKTNKYQLKKAKDFLEIFYDLQKNQGVITQISETSFRSFVAFPARSIKKKEKEFHRLNKS
jgi:hypothetical protein